MINIFLKTLYRIEVRMPVALAARNNVIKRLASSAVKTEIYQTVYRIDFWGLKLFQKNKSFYFVSKIFKKFIVFNKNKKKNSLI